MNRFHLIDRAAVILRSKGVWRQSPVYRYGDELFAKWGAGFLKLHGRGGTGVPHVSWIDVDLPAGACWVEDPFALRLPAASLTLIAEYRAVEGAAA